MVRTILETINTNDSSVIKLAQDEKYCSKYKKVLKEDEDKKSHSCLKENLPCISADE